MENSKQETKHVKKVSNLQNKDISLSAKDIENALQEFTSSVFDLKSQWLQCS